MSTEIERIRHEALALDPPERAAFAEALLASLAPPDPGLDARWAAEAEARLAAFDAGLIDAIDAGDVFDELDRP